MRCNTSPPLVFAMLLVLAASACGDSGGGDTPDPDGGGAGRTAGSETGGVGGGGDDTGGETGGTRDGTGDRADTAGEGGRIPCGGGTCTQPSDPCYMAVCVDDSCAIEPTAAECDDGDPCTHDDTCVDGSCQGLELSCTDPPAPTCGDASTLTQHVPVGLCDNGECKYTEYDIPCGEGCADGGCIGDPCAGVVCNAPPGSCLAASGVCDSGVCHYAALDGGGCDDDDACTVDDTCVQGVCSGTTKTCTTPPAASCVDSDVARVHPGIGACVDGACAYEQTLVICDKGCLDGECVDDPCGTALCSAPAQSCFTGGVCDGAGGCDYSIAPGSGCDDGDPCTIGGACLDDGTCLSSPKLCEDPPPPTCIDDSTLRAYAPNGSCFEGTCAYSKLDTPCALGCADDHCVGDPCAETVCDTPQACQGSPGVCAGGVCSYPPLDAGGCDDGKSCTENDSCVAGACMGDPVPCDDPPPPTCVDAVTLRTFDDGGTCEEAACDYPSDDTTCEVACSLGACVDEPVEPVELDILGTWTSDCQGGGLFVDTFTFHEGGEYERQITLHDLGVEWCGPEVTLAVAEHYGSWSMSAASVDLPETANLDLFAYEATLTPFDEIDASTLMELAACGHTSWLPGEPNDISTHVCSTLGEGIPWLTGTPGYTLVQSADGALRIAIAATTPQLRPADFGSSIMYWPESIPQ